MRRSILRFDSFSMVAGVAASANRRSDAGPVVVSWVRSDRMQAISTRKGSRSRAATTASAVGFQAARCAGVGGSRRRSRRSVFDRLEKLSRAWASCTARSATIVGVVSLMTRRSSRRALYRCRAGPSILTRSGASAILLGVISVGVQTWGVDVAALRRYWAVVDDLGFARITYGDGLWSWTHDGWTMLGALAGCTRRARLGPPSPTARSVLAPSVVARQARSDHRPSVRRSSRSEARGRRRGRRRPGERAHGIAYPDAATRSRVRGRDDRDRERLDGRTRGSRRPFLSTRGAGSRRAPSRSPARPLARGHEPAALSVAARTDGWEASYVSPAAFGERWARLRSLLDAAGRPYVDFRRSIELDVIVGQTDAEVAAELAMHRARHRGGRRVA